MTVRELKDKAERQNIVDIIRHYVKLKKNGANYLGICPFHSEKSPSFTVSPAKNIFKCFGCGTSGDTIAFIQKHEKIGFVEALTTICKLAGLPFDLDEQSWVNDKYKNNQLPAINLKTVDKAILIKTLNYYQNNNFYLFLKLIAGEQKANEIVTSFYIGTSRDGGTLFWQIDQFLRIRTVNKIFYKPDGHRDKSRPPGRPYDPVQKKSLFTIPDGYLPCLFGEHQLLTATKEHLIAVVESEKTAVICSIYLPYINSRPVIYLASSGMNGITDEKMWVLRGLDILLIPDFSYVSRAVWGLLPMRKKEIDGKLKIAKDGDLINDFVSIGNKLQQLKCNVFYYDPFPGLENGTDIADILINFKPVLEALKMPDFDELTLENPFDETKPF